MSGEFRLVTQRRRPPVPSTPRPTVEIAGPIFHVRAASESSLTEIPGGGGFTGTWTNTQAAFEFGCTTTAEGRVYPSEIEMPEGSIWSVSVTVRGRTAGISTDGHLIARIIAHGTQTLADSDDVPYRAEWEIMDGLATSYSEHTTQVAIPVGGYFAVFVENTNPDDASVDIEINAHALDAVPVTDPVPG